MDINEFKEIFLENIKSNKILLPHYYDILEEINNVMDITKKNENDDDFLYIDKCNKCGGNNVKGKELNHEQIYCRCKVCNNIYIYSRCYGCKRFDCFCGCPCGCCC